MFYKNITFYRDYLKTRTENCTNLLPIDLVPPEYLKEKRTSEYLTAEQKELFRQERNQKRRALTDYILSRRTLQVQSIAGQDNEQKHIYSIQSVGTTKYLGSTIPLFISDSISLHLWQYVDRYFLYADKTAGVTMYEIPYSISKHIIDAYYLNLPSVKHLKVDASSPPASIDSLYTNDLEQNDRRADNV